MFSFCHNFCWLRDERFANHKILTDYCQIEDDWKCTSHCFCSFRLQNYLLWSSCPLSKSRGTRNKKPKDGNFQPNSLFQSEFPWFSTCLSSPLQGLRIGDGTLSLFGIKTVHGWLYATSKSPFKSLIDNAIASFFRFSYFIGATDKPCGVCLGC